MQQTRNHDQMKNNNLASTDSSLNTSNINSKMLSTGYKIIDIKVVPPTGRQKQKIPLVSSPISSNSLRPSTKPTSFLSTNYHNASSRNRTRFSPSFLSNSPSISSSSSVSSSNDTDIGNSEPMSDPFT